MWLFIIIIIIMGGLGRRITRITDDKGESAFLFQRLSVLILRYNAVAIQGTFAHTTPRTTSNRSGNAFLLLLAFLFNPRSLLPKVKIIIFAEVYLHGSA